MRRRCLFATNTTPPVPPIEPYLRVDKPEVQWVFPDIPVEYHVESNTDWWIDDAEIPYLMLEPASVLLSRNNPTAVVRVQSNVTWDIMD